MADKIFDLIYKGDGGIGVEPAIAPGSPRPRLREKVMRKYLVIITLAAAWALPVSAQLTSQQQRMKDCNTQASGITGAARKQFMSSCLSVGGTAPQGPHCTKGKPCGNTCIAKDAVC